MCFGSYFAFGYDLETYSDFGNAAITIFQRLFMDNNYEETKNVSETMAIVLLFIFGIVVSLIFMNLLNAILISTYAVIRTNSQLKIEAKARIIANEGKEWTKKLINLLCCRNTLQEEKSLDESDEEPDLPKKDALIKTKVEEEENTLTLCTIFTANLKAVFQTSIETTEAQRIKQNRVIEELKREYEEEKIEEEKKRERNIINDIVQAVLYIIFLVLFIVMLMLQIEIGRIYDANRASDALLPEDFVDNNYIYFQKIPSTISKLIENIYQSKKIYGDKAKFNMNAYVFTNPYLRMVYKRNKMFRNEDPDTNEACPYTLVNNDFKKEENQTSWISESNGLEFSYIGSDQANKDDTGILINFPYVSEKSLELYKESAIDVINFDMDTNTIELFGYIPNSRLFTRIILKITTTLSGLAETGIYHKSFSANQYATTADKARIALEVIVYLFVIYYTYQRIYNYIHVFKSVREKDHQTCPKHNVKHNSFQRLMVKMYVDPRDLRQAGIFDKVINFIFGIILTIYHIIKQFIISIFTYLFEDLSNLINTLIVILCYFMLINW